MAIVKGPLLSLDARGQIGKALTFTGWKGLKTVRQYVVPANPQTTAQTTQRGYFADAITNWHATTWNTADYAAWEELAGIQTKPMSGFNVYVGKYANARRAGDNWNSIYGIATSAVGAAGFTVEATGTGTNTYDIKYGEKPNLLLNTQATTAVAGAISQAISGLDSGKKYYFQIVDTTAGEGALTGISNETTT